MLLAELNDYKICIGTKQTNDFIDDGYHIEIDSLEDDYLYRKYENEEWSEEKFYPEIELQEPQTTLEDKINFIYYKNMGVI